VRPSESVNISEYLRPSGTSSFGRWFSGLDAVVAARVTSSLARLAAGNWSGVKSLGAGLHELRLHFGSGIRVYFGMTGPRILILLGGGTKSGQVRDIARARELWAEFKTRDRQ